MLYDLQSPGVAHHHVMEKEMVTKRMTVTKTLLEGTHAMVLGQLAIWMENSQASSLEEEMETGCKFDWISHILLSSWPRHSKRRLTVSLIYQSPFRSVKLNWVLVDFCRWWLDKMVRAKTRLQWKTLSQLSLRQFIPPCSLLLSVALINAGNRKPCYTETCKHWEGRRVNN